MLTLKLRFAMVLISALVLSACGGGSNEATNNIDNNANNSDTSQTDTGTNTDPNSSNGSGTKSKTDAVVMVSVNADLSDAHPLDGSATGGKVYIFFAEGSDWATRGVKRVDFYCCKNSSSPHTQLPSDTTPIYSMDTNLAQYTDGKYELYIDVFFKDKASPVPFYVNFNIDNSSLPETALNNKPTINGNAASSTYENTAYNFTPTAYDINGDTLNFSIVNKPAWATFNTSSGSLTGTPSSTDTGSYSNIIISVTDGIDTTSLASFNIEVLKVLPTNTPPTISGNPASSVFANSVYSFTATGSDIDGDTLNFSITNKPVWATFNTSSGSLTGTPSGANTGIYTNIIISVTDGKDTTSLASFNIEVLKMPPVNNPPTISGNPASSVFANSVYSFTPAGSDLDSDSLSYSVQNIPAWATFNFNTGQLSGTPSSANIGSYTNIIISVTDGTDTTSLAPFSITVAAQPIPSTGSATLNWTPPTTYTDNTPLTTLAGYKIYYGTSVGNYPNVINVTNPGLTTYVIDNLPGNKTYYFVITAYDDNSIESAFSSYASIYIP